MPSRLGGPRRPLARLLVVSCLAAGCAAPHRVPKTVAGIGAALGVAGGAAWAVGDRADSTAVRTVGVGAVAFGIASLLTAGWLMAASIGCRADADCATGEACREVPAPPGGVPYAQCVPRAQ